MDFVNIKTARLTNLFMGVKDVLFIISFFSIQL